MKFTTSCFVRVEDVDMRKKLVEWLEGQIGYRYCVGCYNARSAIIDIDASSADACLSLTKKI